MTRSSGTVRPGGLRTWVRVAAVAAIGGWALTSHSASLFAAQQTAAAQGSGNGAGGNDTCVVPSSGNGNCSKTFGVTVGKVGLIYPGQTRQLPVTWSNPNSFDLNVESYNVTAAVPSSEPPSPSCSEPASPTRRGPRPASAPVTSPRARPRT